MTVNKKPNIVALVKHLTLILGILCLLSCSTNVKLQGGLINRLKNRGPVALSTDNPFLAANLLVAKEMESSPELKGFIEHRGAPAAIEVDAGIFAPLFLEFYYPENREYYTLEDLDGTWLVSGPYAISREKMSNVARLTRDITGEPRLFNRPQSQSIPAAMASHKLEESGLEKSKFSFAEKTIAAKLQNDTQLSSQHSSQPSSASIYEQTLVQLRTESSESAAEISPKGDLVHYVTYAGETLSMIARWYTDDRANSGRIARISNLKDPNNLNIGDTVIVPSYLVKHKIRLSEAAVEKLRGMPVS